MNLENLCDEVCTYVQWAGALAIRERDRLLDTKIKTNFKDVVTNGDIAVEEFLLKKILHYSFNIISEECGIYECKSEYTWVLDPIDGTTQYAHFGSGWTVSLALLHKDKPVMGIVYKPDTNNLYRAISGKGAYCNDILIEVSTVNSLKEALIDYSYLDDMKRSFLLMERISDLSQKTMVIGSHADSLCKIAEGSLDASISISSPSWDYAAGHVILEEAGGKFTDVYGKPILYDSTKKHVLATNGPLHESITRHLSNVDLEKVVQ